MANSEPPEKLVGALSSGLAVLRYLAGSGTPVGMARVARDFALNSSTCFNILKTLVHEGAGDLRRRHQDLCDRHRLGGTGEPHLQALAANHRVTATLWQRSREERVVLVDLAQNKATVRVHMSIGQRLPLYIAALGRLVP